jgi:hypothetical protein
MAFPLGSQAAGSYAAEGTRVSKDKSYYLQTGQAIVVPSIETTAVTFPNGQSITEAPAADDLRLATTTGDIVILSGGDGVNITGTTVGVVGDLEVLGTSVFVGPSLTVEGVGAGASVTLNQGNPGVGVDTVARVQIRDVCGGLFLFSQNNDNGTRGAGIYYGNAAGTIGAPYFEFSPNRLQLFSNAGPTLLIDASAGITITGTQPKLNYVTIYDITTGGTAPTATALTTAAAPITGALAVTAGSLYQITIIANVLSSATSAANTMSMDVKFDAGFIQFINLLEVPESTTSTTVAVTATVKAPAGSTYFQVYAGAGNATGSVTGTIENGYYVKVA